MEEDLENLQKGLNEKFETEINLLNDEKNLLSRKI